MANTKPNQSRKGFDLNKLLTRQKRDAERLSMAAWAVGGSKEWFRKSPRAEQVAKVQEWVNEAMEAAEQRRERAEVSQRCY